MKSIPTLFCLTAIALLPFSGCTTTSEPQEKVTAPSSDYPVAKRVPDQRNLVFSPFTEESHYVDVAGLDKGTLVKCPWTNKLFYVP